MKYCKPIKDCRIKGLISHSKDPWEASESLGAEGYPYLDITAEEWAPVYAIEDGIVMWTVEDENASDFYFSGFFTRIYNAETQTHFLYSHFVMPPKHKRGEHVDKGEIIGYVGNTNGYRSSMDYHVHIEIKSGNSNPKECKVLNAYKEVYG